MTERRLVSVLFADLVGFTTLGERYDAEKVRELLSQYIDTCTPLITRSGGMLEKFIGDAVMALWGAPPAREDDAERAVRTALELVAAIPVLGQKMGIPELRARVGVATGEAAVAIGATDQNLAAGDLVNTASRIQGLAPPGSVYVADATKRATEAAIVYKDVGFQELKGRTEPIRLWRAIRVIGLKKGALKSPRFEAPFVGRDAMLRLIKEQFHASSEEQKARLIAVTGEAGTGKSRLEWEFRKYLDGLAVDVLWHRGRCLPYGDGVTYSALAEMVKWRAGIGEGEDRASALVKLERTLQTYLADEEEHERVLPRLAHLVGLEDREATNPQDLFGAWRRFFEGMAARAPTVMIFEDLQWADTALLEFITYLMDWSRNHRLFLLALSRPELAERHPGWPAGRHTLTQLHLEPLPPSAMVELLSGLVPGLPERLRSRILERADGIPLYAVETVRMLLDRGLLVPEGNAYRPVGTIDTLEVPETLQALIGQRLDGLTPAEGTLLQDASVLGKVFSIGALAALRQVREESLEPTLTSLVRKEILRIQTDPRSTEQNQYSFLQDLVRRSAYNRLSSGDRKVRHLAAASHLVEQLGEQDEYVEVVASHYLQAYLAAPQAHDAPDIKAQAREMLVRAGHRAASLAASRDAQRYFDRAVKLADDDLSTKAGILEQAGLMALRRYRTRDAEERFGQAISLFEAVGATHPAARVSAHMAEVEWQTGRLDEAIRRMEEAFEVLRLERRDEDLAAFAAQLGRLHFHKGEIDLADARIKTALEIAESLPAFHTLAEALDTKSMILNARGRLREALALARQALDLASEHELPDTALRANRTLAFLSEARDRYAEALAYHEQALDLARKVGDRRQEWRMLSEMTRTLCSMGRWDEALERSAEIPEEDIAGTPFCAVVGSAVEIHLARGDMTRAKHILDLADRCATWVDVPERLTHLLSRTRILRANGEEAEALSVAEQALDERQRFGMSSSFAKAAFVEATEAAFALKKTNKVEQLLGVVESLPPGQRSPFLEAQLARFRARLARRRRERDSALSGLEEAARVFRELGTPYWEAVTLFEHAQALSDSRRADEAEPLLARAQSIFQDLKVSPFPEKGR